MSYDQQRIIDDFCAALRERGIVPPPNGIIADGKFHRCDAENRPGKKGAAYRLHLDDFPAGGFQNHHDGRPWENWKAHIVDTRTVIEKARAAAEIERKIEKRAIEAAQNRADAKQRAEWIWSRIAPPPADYPYAVRKNILLQGLGLYKGMLVVPMIDIHGKLHSLQFIKEDGSKTFLKYGFVEGCFCCLGEPGDTLYICEGYATAATIHQATGAGVVVAFNSGNMTAVARAMRQRYPEKRIVICADDDAFHVLRARPLLNAGLLGAYEAARAVGGYVAVPTFPEVKTRWTPGTTVRASLFRAVATHALLDPDARWYRPHVIESMDRYVAAYPELATAKKLAWGDIIAHLRNETRLLVDETDCNDLDRLMGADAVRHCLERARPAPTTSLEVQDLEFDIAI